MYMCVCSSASSTAFIDGCIRSSHASRRLCAGGGGITNLTDFLRFSWVNSGRYASGQIKQNAAVFSHFIVECGYCVMFIKQPVV